MSVFRIIVEGLRHHWRIHAAVALGVAAATAVLTGALIIGDSVRGSLRQLVLDRLGGIDEMLVLDRFFRQELATELALQPDIGAMKAKVASAILFPAASVQSSEAGGKRLASGVLVVGSDERFWEFEDARRRSKAPG